MGWMVMQICQAFSIFKKQIISNLNSQYSIKEYLTRLETEVVYSYSWNDHVRNDRQWQVIKIRLKSQNKLTKKNKSIGDPNTYLKQQTTKLHTHIVCDE